MKIEIDAGERDAILAGLRLFQKNYELVDRAAFASEMGAIRDIFTRGDAHDGLSRRQIDALCERLNFGA